MAKLTRISSVRLISEGWFSKPKRRVDKPFVLKVNSYSDKAIMDVTKRKSDFRTKSLPPTSIDEPPSFIGSPIFTKKSMGATTPTGKVPAAPVPKTKPLVPTTTYNMPTNVPDARVIMRHPNDISPLNIAISKHGHPDAFSEPKGTHGRPVMHNKRPSIAGIQYPKELSPQENKMRNDADKMMLDAFRKARDKK